MTFATKIQSLVGAHSGIYGPAINWGANQIFENSGSYLTRYGVLSGLEEAFNDSTTLQFSATYPNGIAPDGTLILNGPGAPFNGGIQTVDPTTLARISSGAYSGVTYGGGDITGVLVGSQVYSVDCGPGGGVGGTHKTIISQGTTQVYTDNWYGGAAGAMLCAGPYGADLVYAATFSTQSTDSPQQVQLKSYHLGAVITPTTIATYVPTDLDAGWTQIYFGGFCLDQTDGNLLAFFSGQSGATPLSRFVKINSTTGAIVWNNAVANNGAFPAGGFGPMKNSSITHSRYGYVCTAGTPTIYIINTADGSTVSTQTTGLNGLTLVAAEGCYNDTRGCIVSNMSNTYVDADSATLLNSTPASFSGYGVLYIAEPFSTPQSRRFLAMLGPIRDLQLGPPVSPGPPSNSVGMIGLDVAVSGVGIGGSAGTIALNMDVAGVGFSGSGVSTGTIGLDLAVSGVGSGGASTALTTMTLKNTTTTAQPIGSCTQIFGHPFKKGDIPSGTAPIFKTSGGTIIPFSMSKNLSTWSDGSLKHAAFMLRLPVAISSNGTLAVGVYSGGSIPSASSRALTDFAAGGLDLNVLVTGQDNLFGDWTSNLNQGVSVANSDNYVWMDGDAGKVWRVRASFRQSSADHGQLEGYWFVQALNDASNALGGVRYLCRIAQPWYDINTPTKEYRSFTVFKTRNGASDIRDLAATLPAAKNFTWSSGVKLNSIANGLATGIACKLSTTGALPTGLDSTTLYMCYHGTSGGIDVNSFGLSLYFNDTGGGSLLTPTGPGTGTHTATMYPMVVQFGSLFTAESNGRYSYIQGGGSVASDTTIVCQMDAPYWCRTTLLPPYAIGSYSVASNPTYTYYPGCSGPVDRYVGGTGERDDIGLFNAWQARHIFNQAPVDEQAVRVIGLVGGHLNSCLRQKATKSIPVANNTVYSGMPAPNPTFRNGSTVSGFIPPLNPYIQTQGWSGLDYSHITPFDYYAYLLTGEPQYQDLILEYASAAQIGGYAGTDTAIVNGSFNTIGGVRNSIINGTTRYGVFLSENLLRTPAWLTRGIASTGILPNTNPENSSYQTYFNALLNDTFQGSIDYIAMLALSANAYVTNNGMWSEQQNSAGGINEMWARGYYMDVMAFASAVTEIANARTFANYLMKWPAHVSNTFGAWCVSNYQATERQSSGYNSLYITSDAKYAIYAGGSRDWEISWNSVTNLFTLNNFPDSIGPAVTFNNGDKFIWNGTLNGPLAGGFTGWTPYYVINKSGGGIGSTFQLSATVGGSPVTITDTNSNQTMYCIPAVVPSSGTCNTISYLQNITSASQYLNAIGGTVDGTYLAAMESHLAPYVGGFSTDPKYATRKTYV